MYGENLDRLFADDGLNATLAWVFVGATLAVAVAEVAVGDVASGAGVGVVAVLAALPGPLYRTHSVTLPWEVVAVLAAISGWLALAPGPVAGAIALAAVGLVVVVELHLFTPVRMTHRFAAAFAVPATSAAAGVWALARWLSDRYLGTALLGGHDAVLYGFVLATAAGVGAGLLFDGYVRWWEGRLDRLTPAMEGR